MERIKPDELECRVDEVLFYKWDPIGINHHITARAEYRSYVSRILEEVKNGKLDRIIACLEELQKNSLGTPDEGNNAKEIAELLLSHKEAVENGLA